MSGVRESSLWSCSPASCQQWVLELLYCLKLSSHLYWCLPYGEEGRKIPFPGDQCFCPYYTQGLNVRAEYPLVHDYHAHWSCGGRWTASVASVPVLTPITSSTHFSMSTFRYSDAWIFQACLYVVQGIVCWVTILWIIVSLRRETKESSLLILPWCWCYSSKSLFLSPLPHLSFNFCPQFSRAVMHNTHISALGHKIPTVI